MTLSLPHARPESMGLDSSAILAFVAAAEKSGCDLHSFMLLRHGKVLAEGWWAPYARELPHTLFSLSKSFTATAIGLAVAEGLLALDDPVISFFEDQMPTRVSKRWPQVRVRHLLSMSTGHEKDTMEHIWRHRRRNWIKGILEQAIKREPGTHFVYNNGASYLLAAIIHRVTGQNVDAYLRPRLFAPLGIEAPPWETCPRGIACGGWGLSLKTEDIARFGQLYLQKGLWNGAQVLPEAWVEAATSVQIANGDAPDSDWTQGYGFQFWRCRHDAYRGDGAFGQFCVVMPAQDAVLAMTGGMADMQPALNLVWEHLLPAFQSTPLAEDAAAQAALAGKLSSLAHAPQVGEAISPLAAQVSERVYTFEANPLGFETLVCTFAAGGDRLRFHDRRGSHEVKTAYGAWQHGTTSLPVEAHIPLRVAASGAWTMPNTYTAQLWYYETPFRSTLTFCFKGDRVICNSEANVSFGPTTGPTLIGKAE